jgi:hypothetical protein
LRTFSNLNHLLTHFNYLHIQMFKIEAGMKQSFELIKFALLTSAFLPGFACAYETEEEDVGEDKTIYIQLSDNNSSKNPQPSAKSKAKTLKTTKPTTLGQSNAQNKLPTNSAAAKLLIQTNSDIPDVSADRKPGPQIIGKN